MSDLRTAARQLRTALAPLPIGSTGAVGAAFNQLDKALAVPPEPIPMRIPCPGTVPDGHGGLKVCGEIHIDEGEFATKPHHTHSCQRCGMTWRPAVVATVGVRFLPGFKNDETGATETPAA